MLGGRPDWLRWWYGGLDIPIGLSVFALLIAIIAAAWVFYDSQQRDWNPIWYKVAGVVTTILIIPSAITFLAPCWTLDQGLINSLPLLAAVGVVGGVGAILGLAGYSFGVGAAEPLYTCPTCGRPMHPSWDYCPYCRPATESPPPEPEPIGPTRPVEPPVPEIPPRVEPDPTLLLRAEPTHLAWLIARSGPRAGKEFRLRDVTDIGRDGARNDIVIDDGALSRQHAKVRLQDGQFVLYDLASANGTFVNGEEIQKRVLTQGDTIKVGESVFVFMEVRDKEDDAGEESGKVEEAT